MADPRLVTNRIGAEPKRPHTFKADGSGDIVYDSTQIGGSAVVGRAVMLSGNGVIRLTADATRVLGKLVKVEPDGFCHVEVDGAVDLPSNGTTTANTAIVGALGPSSVRGYIRSAVAATASDVAVQRGLVIDATTASAVEVYLSA
jgi:hypothetical protein